MTFFTDFLCLQAAHAMRIPSKEAVALKNKDKIKSLMILPRIADEQPHSDVLGSYTGTGADGDKPVQDADDL